MAVNKRFNIKPSSIVDDVTVIIDDEKKYSFPILDSTLNYMFCKALNELYNEKEDWKNNCLISVNENSILWNEISILREQGAEPSDAFKNYLNGLKSKNKKLQGDV